MTWRHELDRDGGVPPGTNELRFSDGVLVERGDTAVGDRAARFSEEWLRMTDAETACAVRREGRTARVEVGRWAIEITDDRPGGSFSAARLELLDGRWTVAARLAG